MIGSERVLIGFVWLGMVLNFAVVVTFLVGLALAWQTRTLVAIGLGISASVIWIGWFRSLVAEHQAADHSYLPTGQYSVVGTDPRGALPGVQTNNRS